MQEYGRARLQASDPWCGAELAEIREAGQEVYTSSEIAQFGLIAAGDRGTQESLLACANSLTWNKDASNDHCKTASTKDGPG